MSGIVETYQKYKLTIYYLHIRCWNHFISDYLHYLIKSHYHFREMQNDEDNDYGHHDLCKLKVDVVLVSSIHSS